MSLAALTNPNIDPSIGKFVDSDASIPTTQKFIVNFLQIAFGVAGIVVLFIIIKGAYIYMTSGGDKDAAQRGSKTITTGLIGLSILFSVYAIIGIIEILFGVSIRSVYIPTLFS